MRRAEAAKRRVLPGVAGALDEPKMFKRRQQTPAALRVKRKLLCELISGQRSAAECIKQGKLACAKEGL